MASRGSMQWAAKCRTIRLDVGETASEIIVLGQTLCAELSSIAPDGREMYHSVDCHSDDITVSLKNDQSGTSAKGGVSKKVVYISVSSHSSKIGDKEVKFLFGAKNGDTIGEAKLCMTALYVSLDVDCDRDGVVEENNPNKGSWQWGPGGHGAILLVNNDCEDHDPETPHRHKNNKIDGKTDLKDMSKMALRVRGPEKLPDHCELHLWVSPDDKDRLGIFNLNDIKSLGGVYNKHIIGPTVGNMHTISYDLLMDRDNGEAQFAVEGLKYPDKGFNGTLEIHISLLKHVPVPVFEDTVMFRVAPWIMTPNTQEPIEAFTCLLSKHQNFKFLHDLKKLTNAANIPLNIVPPEVHSGDQWIQDEIEFGYSELHGKTPMPVVLDSPRDRGLWKFPRSQLLGPDFGYVTRYGGDDKVNSLDSFGNLDVSPPVTVDGRTYPMGRILFGSSCPTAEDGRQMKRVVREFLYAQQVQPPLQLFSDWLNVGHIDEFMSFVPANSGKGFRLLLASPAACYKLLSKLKDDGYGDVVCFEGKKQQEKTISELLEDSNLTAENLQYQNNIDWNRDVMKRELGLDDGDIIDLPQLYKLEGRNRAGAYFPDMVNMLVLGKQLGIPKPFGPVIGGECAFETYVRSLLEPLGLTCNFIHDWIYHIRKGEVHCGTNTRRNPFKFKWWDMKFKDQETEQAN